MARQEDKQEECQRGKETNYKGDEGSGRDKDVRKQEKRGRHQTAVQDRETEGRRDKDLPPPLQCFGKQRK